MRDVKEMVGLLMSVLDYAEVAEQEVLDLEFEADGALLAALNEAYIHLLEFVHDRDLRSSDRELDQKARTILRDSLNKIVELCDVMPSRQHGSDLERVSYGRQSA
jgi:hypothetical protein